MYDFILVYKIRLESVFKKKHNLPDFEPQPGNLVTRRWFFQMKPTRESGFDLDADYRRRSCQTKVATAVGHAQPLLYMLLSTAMLIVLVYMFALSFGPDAWSKQRDLTRQHVSHNVQRTANLMRI